MSNLEKLNQPALYIISGAVILLVAVICIIFMIRAYDAGKKLGMSEQKLKQVIVSSASFTVLPAVGILLGVIALAGSLGTPLPWLRLSVIGALHYETQVAEAAAEQVGLSRLSAAEMTPDAFATIALLMTICIMWGMVLAIFFAQPYLKKISKGLHKQQTADPGVQADRGLSNGSKQAPLGDLLMDAMFVGLISAYLGSYIGRIVSADGLFTLTGNPLPLIVSLIAGTAMAVFIYLSEKKDLTWVENFSLAGSMLIAMALAVIIKR